MSTRRRPRHDNWELPPRSLVAADTSGGPVDVRHFERPGGGPVLRLTLEPAIGRAEAERLFAAVLDAVFTSATSG